MKDRKWKINEVKTVQMVADRGSFWVEGKGREEEGRWVGIKKKKE